MPSHAFILGGTGQIGRAIAATLLNAGWDVTISHRGSGAVPKSLVEKGVKVVTLTREKVGELQNALDSGADVLIDTTAYDDSHARQLLNVQRNVGSFVVISSCSVYRDDKGRTLDEASTNGFPKMPFGMKETQATVDPGPATYSTQKIALERMLLDQATIPVSILRPCAIYGVGSRHPREWWLVKRMLDGRKEIPLAYNGTSQFHTCSVENIAALALRCVEKPATQILNIADPTAPSVSEIAATIANHLNYAGKFIEVGETQDATAIGSTPWSVPKPFVLDCTAAKDIGYAAATDYSSGVTSVCDWLVETSTQDDWCKRFPDFANYPNNHFDYDAEDRFFDKLRATT